MKSLCYAAALCLAAVAAATAAPAPAPKPANNKAKIVGLWELVKTEEGLPAGTRVEFTKGGKLTLVVRVDGKELRIEGTYSVDGDKLTTGMKGPDGKSHEETMTIPKLTDKVLHTKDAKGRVSEFRRTKK